MENESLVRKELVALLRGGNAHMTFEDLVADFPLERINDRPPNMPYAPWHILEHMRRAQHDILWFIRDPDYESPPWPEGFFPAPSGKTDEAGWEKIVQDFLTDRKALEEMAKEPQTDLFGPIAHAKTYTICREIMLAADHNAYHTGELVLMRQVMHAWPEGEENYDATG
ncbi:MAG: DinB family protein [Desulfobacterales bacterium]|nr:DinB family protein [Desulfobacterales bacterium]